MHTWWTCWRPWSAWHTLCFICVLRGLGQLRIPDERTEGHDQQGAHLADHRPPAASPAADSHESDLLWRLPYLLQHRGMAQLHAELCEWGWGKGWARGWVGVGWGEVDLNTVELLIKDDSDERPSCWKTTLLRDHPDERPPCWETTLMGGHPAERPPWWEITLMRDHPDERPPW